jgi:hypothetical protein
MPLIDIYAITKLIQQIYICIASFNRNIGHKRFKNVLIAVIHRNSFLALAFTPFAFDKLHILVKILCRLI